MGDVVDITDRISRRSNVISLDAYRERRGKVYRLRDELAQFNRPLASYVTENIQEYLAMIASFMHQPVVESHLFGDATFSITRCGDTSRWGVVDYCGDEDGVEEFEVSDSVIGTMFRLFDFDEPTDALECAATYVSGFVVGTAIAQELEGAMTPEKHLGSDFDKLAELTGELQAYRFAAGITWVAMQDTINVDEPVLKPRGSALLLFAQSLYVPMDSHELISSAQRLSC